MTVRTEVGAAFVCLTLVAAPSGAAEPAPTASTAQVAVHKLQQDVAAAEALAALMASVPRQRVLFHNVSLVDPVAGVVVPGRSVIVSGRKIAWVGAADAAPKVDNLRIVEGTGRYLAPGLSDMHVHTNNHGDWLLDLSAGVTTVRDMAGFPWMLKAREAIDANRLLAPVIYVAGPLINGFPLEGFAIVPRDPVDARRMVRQEAACGYDFIKVHNVVPMPIFDAVAEEAKALDMDLVGHVPHDIPVRHAVERGMRTMEHMKGFLNDATLTLGDTDYAAAIDGPPVWNTPTLYAGLAPLKGEEGRTRLKAPDISFAPLRDREAWTRDLDTPDDASMKAFRASRAIQLSIVAKLHAEHARFLAGTDSANYPFQVRGFALLDEMSMLQAAGLSPVETLQAATSEPAKAMRDEGAFGEIKVGERADLVLLDSDPTRDTAAYRGSEGVVAHGYWLPRRDMDRAMAALAASYAEEDRATVIDRPAAEALLTRLSTRESDGDVFNAGEIEAAADALRTAGFVDIADRLAVIAYAPTLGPCAEVRPQ
ncbi:MAG TPA: amidohydrolase family protein [Caulobacteraceae bacterium]|jgi:imidazolonepropionase-like amidohydrolase|nr:amidohydrolase family protein [Caulobacteraceae bacterium]